MIVNDLGFDYLIFGEETIPCMAHHLEHPDNQDMPWPANLSQKKSSWILFRLMIEQIHSNGKPYLCAE